MPLSLAELPLSVRQTPVLLVDDSALQREYAAELLNALGLALVSHAANGREALEALRQMAARQMPLPLLFLDLEMPDMDGIELLMCLHEEGICPPVVVASSCEEALVATVLDMIRTLRLPLVGNLPKPLSGQGLHGLLQHLPEAVCLPQDQPPRPASQVTESGLREAMAKGLIRPHYQPKIELERGQLLGYEVLARWHDPVQGLIYPGDFIALATESGLLPEMTFSLIDQMLIDAARLQAQGWTPSMAVNVDISLLANRDFANELINRVQASGARAEHLILEITESALMHDTAATLASVGRLRLAGFGLSIDDYGTGFSTLQQLTRLPFTELKIDRAFIAGAHHNRRSHAILQSAIDMGVRLRLPSIAEGVETVEEVHLLRGLGCSAAQGYLFARPMPGEALLDWHGRHVGKTSLDEWLTD